MAPYGLFLLFDCLYGLLQFAFSGLMARLGMVARTLLVVAPGRHLVA